MCPWNHSRDVKGPKEKKKGKSACGDPSTRHFTGKERDAESGLDYFGARSYASRFGRFVTADWSAAPVAVPYADLTNPQSLNLYALVRGNPSTFADLDGHLAPGQLGSSGGMGIAPRMRAGGGSAYGCLDSGCDSGTVYELLLDGIPTGELFYSEAAGRAYIADMFAPKKPDANGREASDFHVLVSGSDTNCTTTDGSPVTNTARVHVEKNHVGDQITSVSGWVEVIGPQQGEIMNQGVTIQNKGNMKPGTNGYGVDSESAYFSYTATAGATLTAHIRVVVTTRDLSKSGGGYDYKKDVVVYIEQRINIECGAKPTKIL